MKKKTLWIIATGIIILTGALSGGAYYLYKDVVDIDTIYEGIYIEKYDVGGMTKEEAEKHVKQDKIQELKGKSMNLNYKDKVYNLSLNDIEFNYDSKQAVERAFTLCRTGNLFNRYKEIKRLKNKNVEIPLEFKYEQGKIKKEVDKIAEEINEDAIDAKFNFNNGNFTVSPEQWGRSVKKDELISYIRENIEDLNDIDIPLEKTKPKYTQEYYTKINGLLGEYSTSFKGSSSGRITNIKVSAKAFDDLLIHPGQEISYNEITGPKNKAYGYKEAPVIVGGELVPGLGGGVCQTSTTIYNTLLLADLTIIERSPHSLPPTYVKLGRDAAVASGYLDLKFRNDFDYPIYMTSKVVGTRVYFSVYGDALNRDYKVRISQEVVDFKPFTTKRILDEKMEPGTEDVVQKGRNGYKSKTYKSIIKNGKVIDTKVINSDYYRERQLIIKHGPELPEETKPVSKPGEEIQEQEPPKPKDPTKVPEEDLNTEDEENI